MPTPRRWRVVPSALVLAALSAASAAGAQDYTFHTIAAPAQSYTFASKINNRGQIVGSSGRIFQSAGRGFLYEAGVFTFIEVPGAGETPAYGINDRGQVVGSAGNALLHRGYVREGSAFRSVEASDAVDTRVYDINAAGQIVGAYGLTERSERFGRGFLYGGSTFTPLTPPGTVDGRSSANGLNDAGQIVGSFYDGLKTREFLYVGGSYRVIEPTFLNSGGYSEAHDINNAGQVVGWWYGDNTIRGYVYDGATYRILDVPGALDTYAYGVNDRGDVVGYYRHAGGYSGFLATCVATIPEPGTLGLFALGLLTLGLSGLGAVARRRTQRDAGQT